MLHDQIIRFPVTKHLCQVRQPFILEMSIHRVKYYNFFVHDHIRIIGHTIRHIILSLK